MRLGAAAACHRLVWLLPIIIGECAILLHQGLVILHFAAVTKITRLRKIALMFNMCENLILKLTFMLLNSIGEWISELGGIKLNESQTKDNT